MKNRFLSVLLTLCMVLAMFPGTAMAAGEVDSTGIGVAGDMVYALRSDVTLTQLVNVVPANGTVRVDKTDSANHTYALAGDTAPVAIDKAITLQMNGDCAADLNVVEGGALTVTGSGKLTGALTMSAGTYTGALPTGVKTITGGTFDSDVSAYIDLAEYQCVANETAKTWTVSARDKNSVVTEPAKPTEEVNDEGVKITVATATVTETSIQQTTVGADGTLVINTVSQSTATATKAVISLPTAAVKAKQGVESVAVQTNVGTVDLPVEALEGVDEDVKLVVEQDKKPDPVTPAGSTTAVNMAVSFDVSLEKATGGEVKVELNTEIRLSFTVGQLSMTNPVLAYINRTTNLIEALLNPSYANGIISGSVKHLSEFAVVEQADIPDTSGDDNTTNKDWTITVSGENGVNGGASNEHYRTISLTYAGDDKAPYLGKNLAIRITDENDKISMMTVPASAEVNVSYTGAVKEVYAKLVTAENGVSPMGRGGIAYGSSSK